MTRGTVYDERAAETVDEYFEWGLVPEDVREDVTGHLANDEPIDALEAILCARRNRPRPL